ncbi:MAG: NAD(P)-dependent oxidoreductase [Lachnospiraceae bacterium]|nr:NAD(P)-dependent oxidoreductase [Lachnospiraceae bacterium]
MKILVTGADGYIGRHVTAELLRRDCEVIASDLHTDGIDPRARIAEADIFSEDPGLFEKLGSPDVLIHLAWRNGFDHYNRSHVDDLPKHYRFLTSMMDQGLRQLVVMSTMHEVGYYEGAIDENTPTKPLTPYGISKNALRELTQIYAAGRGTLLQWLRGFYLIGDDERNNSVFSRMVKLEAEGAEVLPFTTGSNKFDFITVDELAAQIVSTALQTEICGIINVCSGIPVPLAEKAEEFIRLHHMKLRLGYGQFPDRADASPAVWGNPDKIRKIMQKEKNSAK